MCPINRFPASFISLQGRRLLVVDNDVDSCDLIELLLQPYGVEVKSVSLVQQALHLIGQWQPDILVSEIALPEEDGFTLIQHVRTLTGSWGETVPVVAVTACATEEIRQRAFSCGFDRWFAKPLDLDAFVVVLASLTIHQQPANLIGLVMTCQIVQQLLDQVLDSNHLL